MVRRTAATLRPRRDGTSCQATPVYLVTITVRLPITITDVRLQTYAVTVCNVRRTGGQKVLRSVHFGLSSVKSVKPGCGPIIT